MKSHFCHALESCDVPVFENARATGDATWFKVNDRLDYECDEGYKNGNGHTRGTIVCGDSGWSEAPTCRGEYCFSGIFPFRITKITTFCLKCYLFQ